MNKDCNSLFPTLGLWAWGRLRIGTVFLRLQLVGYDQYMSQRRYIERIYLGICLSFRIRVFLRFRVCFRFRVFFRLRVGLASVSI